MVKVNVCLSSQVIRAFISVSLTAKQLSVEAEKSRILSDRLPSWNSFLSTLSSE